VSWHLDRQGLRLGYNAAAAAAAGLTLPAAHAVLRVFGDRQPAAQLGAGITVIGLAALLDWRFRRWPTRFLLWAAVLGVLTDLPVLSAAVRYLTGAS